jgi:hypothetical protein
LTHLHPLYCQVTTMECSHLAAFQVPDVTNKSLAGGVASGTT